MDRKSLVAGLVKGATEYARGKERRAELPKIPLEQEAIWEFGIHDHRAERRGRHFDLRLGDPKTGDAHSWAMPPSWPEPGKMAKVVEQPTHTVEYMDFAGKLPKGYGAGDVKLEARDKVEVLRSRPGHITFHRFTSKGPEEYTLHRVKGKHWRLYNRTFHRGRMEIPVDVKPDYREEHPEKVNFAEPNTLMSAKIDDAHNLFLFPKDDRIRVVSWRKGKKRAVIEHTHKVPALLPELKTPKGLEDTVLRGGLYGLDPKTKKAIESQIIGGLLNANVWKSREQQKGRGLLRSILYDVVRFRGKDMEKAPYKEKLEILKEVQEKLPDVFDLPSMAFTEKDKRRLLEEVRSGKTPETTEGVVLWDLESGDPPIKVKFSEDHDVFIRGFFAGAGKYRGKAVGGFVYSHSPTGAVVGKVGTGLSDRQRKDMFENPEKYDRVVACVKAPKMFESGALGGSPAFLGYHLDKNDQDRLDELA